MDLEEKMKSLKLDSNSNLYDHLMNIIGKVNLDQENRPYDNFEKISVNIK